jgi:hypothetical protein
MCNFSYDLALMYQGAGWQLKKDLTEVQQSRLVVCKNEMLKHKLQPLCCYVAGDTSCNTAGFCHEFGGVPFIGFTIISDQAGELEFAFTILHEIAHALVGTDHGHDPVWQAKALELGSGLALFRPPTGESGMYCNAQELARRCTLRQQWADEELAKIRATRLKRGLNA